MKILFEGKIKQRKDNWYWRCPECHTIGYHETDDNYTSICSDGHMSFLCPICHREIRDDRYLNRLIAWLLYKLKYK